tara:strand:- start:857 stop:1039 length:183 start_codon:yes stop_codon:yes gene_type:complete
MTDFFEIDENKKTLRIINLDDLSIDDLNQYLGELNQEIDRVKGEILKKNNYKKSAEKLFK